MLEWIFLSPVVASAACLLLSSRPRAAEAAALLGVLGSIAALAIFLQQGVSGFDFYGMLYLDSLSLLFICVSLFAAFFVFLYSIGYMRREVEEGAVEARRIPSYYAWLLVFLSTILISLLTANSLITWASIEATTLTSVFLISFYNKKESVEAAWKYFIICTLGITVAMIGTIVLNYAFISAGEAGDFLWSSSPSSSAILNPFLLKIAFAFILVGYGTKMGLAPLHVWLPDAHSQAPTPVSALLSGVLLNVALYAILRSYHLVSVSPEAAAFASTIFLSLGLFTIALASLRMYSQEHYKRLLAYSSVENMGIIAIALGIGGPLGFLAALLHVVAHSLVKPLAFFIGGTISLTYDTKEMRLISGAAKVLPVFGLLFVLTATGVAGGLPFGTFFSEFVLLGAALSQGQYLTAVLVILFTSVAFGSLLIKSSGMAFGPVTHGVHKPFSSFATTAAIAGLFLAAVFLGLFMPASVASVIQSAAALLSGGI